MDIWNLREYYDRGKIINRVTNMDMVIDQHLHPVEGKGMDGREHF